ncbi:MAG: hypothetical protein ACSHX0_05450 [Akkermansiaceae bacterium]
MRTKKEFPALAIINPNKAWVSAELDKLLNEWALWHAICQELEDSPDYDPQTCTEALKDGRYNLDRHEILREKTLVFLRNHFSGAEFVLAKWDSHPHEDITSRLRGRVPGWIHKLEILKASMDYVQVPDGFWKEKSKALVDVISKSAPEKAIEIAATYLRNPLAK